MVDYENDDIDSSDSIEFSSEELSNMVEEIKRIKASEKYIETEEKCAEDGFNDWMQEIKDRVKRLDDIAASESSVTTDSPKIKLEGLDGYETVAHIGGPGYVSRVPGPQIRELSHKELADLGCEDLRYKASDHEHRRATKLGMSLDVYHEMLSKRPVKKDKPVGASEGDDCSGLAARRRKHLKNLRSVIADHLNRPEEEFTLEDIEKLNYDLCPQRGVPLTPHHGVSEVEAGFKYYLKEIEKEIDLEVLGPPPPDPKYVTVAKTISSVIDSLAEKATAALDEVLKRSKRAIGHVVKEAAQSYLNKMEPEKSTISDEDRKAINKYLDTYK